MHWTTFEVPLAFKEGGRTLEADTEYVFDDIQASAFLSSGQSIVSPRGCLALGQVTRLAHAEFPPFDGTRDWNDRRVLVHRAGGLGDLLLMTPAIRQLKRQWPRVRIYVCTMPAGREPLRSNPHIEGFAEFPPSRAELATYDGLIFCENSIENNPKGRDTHAVDLYAERFGVTVDPMDRRPDLVLSDEDRRWTNAGAYRPIEGLPRIGLQVKASTPVRTYPAGPTSDLIEMLLEMAQVFLLGAPDEVVADESDRLVNCSARKLTFRQSCGVLETCHVCIAPDSAIVHAAAAFQIPTVALYGPFPAHLRLTDACQIPIEANGLCAPCFHHSRGKAVFPPRVCRRENVCHVLGALPPARIFAAVMQLVRQPLP